MERWLSIEWRQEPRMSGERKCHPPVDLFVVDATTARLRLRPLIGIESIGESGVKGIMSVTFLSSPLSVVEDSNKLD